MNPRVAAWKTREKQVSPASHVALTKNASRILVLGALSKQIMIPEQAKLRIPSMSEAEAAEAEL